MSIPEQKSVDPLAADSNPLQAAQPQQQPRTQKQRTNVYTMMLIVSFAACVTACVLLYLHLSTYGEYPWWDTKAVNSLVGP
ncbi:MAG: hypothetical protein KDA71_03195 [Planctomycetales bacterium]|nr:hypothetical protein [Planctomycetales bacterium]